MKLTGGTSLIIMIVLLVLACHGEVRAQDTKPITKANLISSLRLGKQQGKSAVVFIELIRLHGVNFHMTLIDEKRIRRAGEYLGPKKIEELLESVRNNYRAAGTQRALTLHVTDLEGEPLEGVVLSNKGDGFESDHTDRKGITHINLPPNTLPQDSVFLQLVPGSKGNQDLEIVGDGRVMVPPFDGKPDRYVSVVLVRKSAKRLLVNKSFLDTFSIDYKSNMANSPNGSLLENRLVDGAENAKVYGAEATEQLVRFYEEREKELEEKKSKAAYTISARAQTLFLQRNYSEAILTYHQALKLRPNDYQLLNSLGLALIKAERYPEAESIYIRFVTIKENVAETDHQYILAALKNYIELLRKLNREGEAEKVEAHAKALRVRSQWGQGN